MTEQTSTVERLLTQAEAADLLRVSVRSLYALRKTGRLRAVIVGPGAVRFDPRDIDQFIAASREGSAT